MANDLQNQNSSGQPFLQISLAYCGEPCLAALAPFPNNAADGTERLEESCVQEERRVVREGKRERRTREERTFS